MTTSGFATQTGIASSTPPVPIAIAPTMLYTPTPTPITGMFAEEHEIQAAQGTGKIFVGVPNNPPLQAVTGTASQGPAPLSPPTYFSVTITTQLYSQATLLPVTTRISSQIPWLAVIANNSRIASVRTEELITRNALLSTANTIQCAFGTNGQKPCTEPGIQDMLNVQMLLDMENAPQSSRATAATTRYNSYGHAYGYIMMTAVTGKTVFTSQSPNNFTAFQAASQPEDRQICEIGTFVNSGIRVLGSTDWPLSGITTTTGQPIIRAVISASHTYTRLVHPELYHRLNVVGSAYLGINNLQEGVSIQYWGAAGILQRTWLLALEYSYINVNAVIG